MASESLPFPLKNEELYEGLGVVGVGGWQHRVERHTTAQQHLMWVTLWPSMTVAL